MKKLKQVIRLFGITLLLMLAMCGVGFLGALFPIHRESIDKPTTIERKDENAGETDSETQKE